MDNQYWANLAPDEIAGELVQRVTNYYTDIERLGRLGLWQRVHRHYFALDKAGRYDAVDIGRGGSQNELSTLRANHYRNLLQHLLVLVTQNQPSFDCRAINSDYNSQVAAILGNNVIEYYMREQHEDAEYRAAAELAIVYSEAYLEKWWDADAGNPVAGDPTTGEQITPGDVCSRLHEPINVVRPIYSTGDMAPRWYILRSWENKYELAAQHPDYAEDILRAGMDDFDRRYSYYQSAYPRQGDDDLIPVYKLIHDRTDACPTGRVVKFLSSRTVLDYTDFDALKQPEFPVYPMIPQRQHGTTFGYTVAFDLLCVQEAIDLLYSTVLSNQAAFGIQNLWIKPGSNLTPSMLGGGLNVLESTDKPEPINLTYTPPEIFKFLQGLEKLAEVLSGINSVARGQPDTSLESGAALALVASQAVQFANGLQAAYVRLLSDGATATIRLLQEHAAVPRLALIAGKANRSYTKPFTSADLKAINRVIVDIGNPMSHTVAGRIQMAQDMIKAQIIKRPEQYIQVVNTGNLDPLIEDTRNENLLVQAENEAMRDGKPVVVTAVDDHLAHIRAHRSVLSDPDARLQPQLVQSVLGHIQEHLQQLRTADPQLLNMLGQQPLQPEAPPGEGANAPQPLAKPGPEDAPPPGGNHQPDTAPPGAKVQPPPGTPPNIAAHMPEMPKSPGQPIPPQSNPTHAA